MFLVLLLTIGQCPGSNCQQPQFFQQYSFTQQTHVCVDGLTRMYKSCPACNQSTHKCADGILRMGSYCAACRNKINKCNCVNCPKNK